MCCGDCGGCACCARCTVQRDDTRYRTVGPVHHRSCLEGAVLQCAAGDIECAVAQYAVFQCATHQIEIACRRRGQCVGAVEIGGPCIVECAGVSARAIEVESGACGRRERTAVRLTVGIETKITTVDTQCAGIGHAAVMSDRIN